MTDPIEFEPHRAHRYRKRGEILAFESKDPVTYHKSWGTQELPKGAWMAIALDDAGRPTADVYGIDDDAFQATYAPSETGQPHRYMKTAIIEAYPPGRPFWVRTELDDRSAPGGKKVETERAEGSETAMLVRNPGGEVYPVEREEFERVYVEVRTPTRATTRDEHLDPSWGPKRILALDGGGVRNLVTLGILEGIERLLRDRHQDPDLKLSDYFDLIAGTSTGAAIGAALAMGRSVNDVIDWYRKLAPRIFGRHWTPPLMRPKHDPAPFATALKELFSDARLGGEQLKTGLLVITKRLDERGVWPLANNPQDPAYSADKAENRAGSADYVLREVVRASAAAPFPLQPDEVEVFEGADSLAREHGVFINGGTSPHNNPALQALLVAARTDHGLGWTTGANHMFVASVGSGWSRSQHALRGMSTPAVVESLHTMLNEAAEQIETMMQWLSESDTSREIDAGVGTLKGEFLAGRPLISYARYDAQLDAGWLNREVGLDLTEAAVERMQPLDARKEAIDGLLEVGRKLASRRLKDGHFPADFDLPAPQ